MRRDQVDDLRVAVIGAGGRGVIAAYAHRPGSGSRIVACCATDPQDLEASRMRYGSDVYTTNDYRALLEQPLDAVFVCTPDYLHEEHAVAALERGLAVYLEKPMAITIAGCDRILRAAMDAKARLYVGHNMRHMAFVRQMKDLIDQGVIGEVKTAWCRHFVGHGGDFYFKDWHAEQRNTTGMLLQKATHDIDVLHWLCGSYTRRVNAMGGLTLYDQITDRHAPEERGDNSPRLENWPPLSNRGLNPIIDIEDISMINMQLENGVFVAYQQCHFTPDYWRNYTVIGTEGRIENEGNTEPGTVIKLWNSRRWEYGPADQVFPITSDDGSHGGADPRIVAEFLDFARNGGHTTTSPLGARASVAAGCLATESLRNGGQPYDLPPVEAELQQYFENAQY